MLVFPRVDAHAWGREGHQVVVQLALRLMQPAQRRATYELLGTHDWSAIGRWADSVRPHRADSEQHWHYVDIPLEADAYDEARDCKPTCIIDELERARAIVRDHSAPRGARREALLFWFHLVGDLHQPFHCYNNGDRGGNQLKVWFHGKRTSIHGLWDNAMLRYENPNAWSLASDIFNHHQYPAKIPSFVEAANLSHIRAREALLDRGATVTAKYLRHEWSILTRSLWEAACMAAEIGPDV